MLEVKIIDAWQERWDNFEAAKRLTSYLKRTRRAMWTRQQASNLSFLLLTIVEKLNQTLHTVLKASCPHCSFLESRQPFHCLPLSLWSHNGPSLCSRQQPRSFRTHLCHCQAFNSNIGNTIVCLATVFGTMDNFKAAVDTQECSITKAFCNQQVSMQSCYKMVFPSIPSFKKIACYTWFSQPWLEVRKNELLQKSKHNVDTRSKINSNINWCWNWIAISCYLNSS